MTSSFNVHDAAGYEQLMGRWSRKLAPKFIDFAGVADGEKVLDVGCGTGSLTFALADAARLKEIAARSCAAAAITWESANAATRTGLFITLLL